MAARRALKASGGLLLIGHSHRAMSTKLLGRKSPIFDIEHLQLFSPISLRRLLHRAGFSRVRIMPVFNRYPVQYWARLFPMPRSTKQRTLRLLESTRIGRMVIPLPAGNVAAFAQ